MRIPLLLAALIPAMSVHAAPFEWSAYGGDGRGQRYAPLAQITPKNVERLELAWDFRTGELGEGFDRAGDALTFEATPLFVDDTLYVSTATGKVFALDAAHGTERWRFDAKIDRGRDYSEMTTRGVSYWRGADAAADAVCGRRIVFATIDARLFAIDAKTGKRCTDFGADGEIALSKNVRLIERQLGNYQVTSPPAIVGDVAIVGSSIGDNRGTDIELGVVRAFDVRSGRELWHWDPIPRAAKLPAGAANPDFGEVEQQVAHWTGAANAWAPFAADAERGLVFIPTGSASPDFFGGERPGDDQWADSLVALRAATGEFVWGRQLVHHDLWDYDTASQPMLVELDRNGTKTAAVVQLTKTGQVFVFDRDTGAPLFPIEERAVPHDAVAGEAPSPTQPFSSLPPLVSHAPVKADDAWGLHLLGSRRVPRQNRRAEERGHFHAAEPRRHDRTAGLCRRLELGRRRVGSRAAAPDRECDGSSDGRHADSCATSSASGIRLRPLQRLGIRAADRHAVRDATPHARFAARRTVHGAAMGQARRGRSRAGQNRLGTTARHVARQSAMAVLVDRRRAEHGRPAGPPAVSSSLAQPPTIICARSISSAAPNCGRCAFPRARRRRR
jgi:glucose dehydrogenase